jgi:large repetitive protein
MLFAFRALDPPCTLRVMRLHTVVVMLVLGGSGIGGGGCGDNLRPGGTNPDGPIDAAPDAMPIVPGETFCEVLPALPSGTCQVTGTGTGTLLKGNVLAPATIYRGGQVAVDAAGMITCVGCNCAAADQAVVTCPDAAISPGLINTHDHITFTQNQPYTDTGVRYEHRHQWRIGQDGKPQIPSTGSANADQIRWGELRFLMGGATSIVGSGNQRGLLRNLDGSISGGSQEGLNQSPVNFDTFPLDDTSGTRRTKDCNYGVAAMPTTAASIAGNDAYEPHTSEGIDASARNEFLCETTTTWDAAPPGVANDLLLSKTAMIHAIGLQAQDLGAMATAGTGLIWSPRSNITLYGDTARVTTAARFGIEIALGTDWMPTGSMSLLRELRCADGFNKTHLGGFFTDKQLWQMVTQNAAALTATDDVIGQLAPGRVADIAIFTGHRKTYRAVIDAEPADVALVMRGGKVLYGDDATVGAFALNCDAVDVCGAGKRVCLMSEVGKTYTQLQTGAGTAIYPAFACLTPPTAPAPPNEPTCTPKRPTSANGSTIYDGTPKATDGDGDGILDTADRCPTVFDPVRPVDNGVQPDADGDGLGDACDPCPLDANITTCTPVALDDRDHDGTLDATDNCPFTANPGQADGDMDSKGDACDPCPTRANPGTSGCPATIYEIKNGTLSLETPVRLTGALVTGKGANGFFVQVKETDAGYTGADYSGLFVFTGGAPAVAVGDRVTLDGTITNFQGQLELDSVTGLSVTSSGDLPPAAIPAAYAEIKTGGARALTLESVIVQVGVATVSAVDTMFGEFTLADGADSLVADDFIFALTPAPSVGMIVGGAIGILALRQMVSKLELRGAADLIPGPPTIATFAPALSYAQVGQTVNMPTFPAPLTVTLTAPAQGDTIVTITSGDTSALTVTNVTIPDGQTTGVVNVTAGAQSAAVTVTAAIGAVMKTATVRVLGAAEVPTVVTLSPSVLSVPILGSVQLTATLDVPASAGGTVVTLAATGGTLPVPPTVTVGAGQFSATFPYIAPASGIATVTATLLASTSNVTLHVLDHILISQVYGGGGNTGAMYINDFIELHNPTAMDLSVAGMSVQYASSTGTSWTSANVTVLPNLTIPAGGYLLIQEAAGAGGTTPLPTPDVIPMAPQAAIAMAAGAGKVALVNGTTPLTGTGCPIAANVIDFIGHGAANCARGTPTAVLSNTTAALRVQSGCLDTKNNSTNFAVGPPAPRNSASPAVICP